MEAAVQAGFDYVELMGKYLVSLQERDFAMLLRQQDRLSLPVLGLNGYCPKRNMRMSDMPGKSLQICIRFPHVFHIIKIHYQSQIGKPQLLNDTLPVLGLNGYCPKQIQMIGRDFNTGRATPPATMISPGRIVTPPMATGTSFASNCSLT